MSRWPGLPAAAAVTAAGAVAAIGVAGLFLHWPVAAPLIAAGRLLRWAVTALYAVTPVLALGMLLSRRVVGPDDDNRPGWRFVVAWALGWTAVVLLGILMLASGCYYEPIWTAAAALGNVACLALLVRRRWRPLIELRADALRVWRAWRGRGRGLGIWELLILGSLASAFLLASLPPDARDELVYHLALPQFWRFQHSWWVPLDNAHWLFPANAEVIWGYGLGVGGIHLPRLLTLTFGLAVLTLLAGWLSEAGADRWTQQVSLAFLLVAPMTLVLLGTCNVEWPMVFFLLLGWRASRSFIASGARRHAALTAVAWGACMGFKYTALPVVAGLACEWEVASVRRRGFRRALAALVMLALAAALLTGGWLVRNWRLTGDPLYPIGTALQRSAGAPAPDATRLLDYSRLSGAWRLFPWLYHATADPLIDQRMHPGWPLLLLAVALFGWRRAGERPWFTVVAVSLLFLPFSPATRAYVPVMVLAWLFLPDFLRSLASRRCLRLTVSATVGTLALTSLPWFMTAFIRTPSGPPSYLIGNISDDELLRQEGVMTPVVRWIRSESPQDARIWVWGGEQTFYLDRWARASSFIDKPLVLSWFEKYGEAGLSRKVAEERLDFILVDTANCGVPPTSIRSEGRVWPIAPALQPAIAHWMRANLREVGRDSSHVLFLIVTPHPA